MARRECLVKVSPYNLYRRENMPSEKKGAYAIEPTRTKARCWSCWAYFFLGELPQHANKVIWKRIKIDVEFAFCSLRESNGQQGDSFQSRYLTFDIVLRVCIGCLILVNHADNLQQIVLTQSLEIVGKLFHVNLYRIPVSIC